jgi:uncharacterized membrane protein
MADSEETPGETVATPAAALRWILGPLATRPKLVMAFVVGIVVGLAAFFLTPLKVSTAAIVGWDATCLTLAVSMLTAMANKEPRHIAAAAVEQDEGQGVILAIVVLAAVASVVAVGVELSLAKDAHGVEKAARVMLAFLTVAASWFTVALIFALHYAHEFYSPADCTADGVAGGLVFPGGDEPDYWDFLHFALVIGVAAQTADIGFASKGMRRTGTIHCVLAFVFNTVVLALTINLLAGLF